MNATIRTGCPRPFLILVSLAGALTLSLAVATAGEPAVASEEFLALARGLIETAYAQSDAERLKPFQTLSLGPPPLPPDAFNPDAGQPPVRARLFDDEEITLQLRTRISLPPPPKPPAAFNPDPGARPPPPEPFYQVEFGLAPPFGLDPVPPELALPRAPLTRRELVPQEPPPPGQFGAEPVPEPLKLPREETRLNEQIPFSFHAPEYPLSRRRLGLPPHSEPKPDRWRVGFVPWRRYTAGETETPYEAPTPRRWHPYQQSVLKGDLPVIGQDIFLNLTASMQTEFEARRIPTASGISAARPGAAEFFGQSDQLLVLNNLGFAMELFKGETAFKPVDWAIRLQPVYNVNYTYARETGVISPDPRGPIPAGPNVPPPDLAGILNPGDIGTLLDNHLGPAPQSFVGRRHTTRLKDYLALQEAFVEVHLADLSVNYDFIAARIGNQVFNSDFRGFIFNDVNSGLRVFGNAANNHFQYNVAVFDLREKDTNSELNTFDRRGLRVLIANLYRQDFLVKGYTAQLSFHAAFDEADIHFDENGNIVRPAPIGAVREHDVDAYYLGWTGDGHIGRLNLSHAFYQALGRDEFNGLAGRPTDINAQFAAVELSYDRDWVRYKASLVYASGDGDATDGTARGFDTILDNPNFTGGPFSFYVRQGFNLAGTAVNLKQRNSLVPNLRTSKTQGQANFVNPGIFIAGLGSEIEVTPKLRAFLNANYLRFVETDPIKTALLTDQVRYELGWDLSLGVQYRPLLTDNIIISAGFGALIPGSGYRDIYRRNTDPVPGFNPAGEAGKVNDFLYSAILAITLTY